MFWGVVSFKSLNKGEPTWSSISFYEIFGSFWDICLYLSFLIYVIPFIKLVVDLHVILFIIPMMIQSNFLRCCAAKSLFQGEPTWWSYISYDIIGFRWGFLLLLFYKLVFLYLKFGKIMNVSVLMFWVLTILFVHI